MKPLATVAAAALLFACESPRTECDPDADTCRLTRTFPPQQLQAGEEVSDLCMSWTLNNETELWVNRVESRNGGLVHHSNWFFVPDFRYDVPDGAWDCAEEDFDELANALLGGVLHAQSTQARTELQQFRDGAAIRVPPFSRVVANVHMLNASDQAASTSLAIDVDTIPPAGVTARLVPFELMYLDLDLSAEARSEFRVDCDVTDDYRAQVGTDFDARIHWMMPHYHALGDMYDVRILGGERDGESVFASQGDTYGEALGRTFEPPIDLGAAGARGLSFTCGFDNPRPERVGWGIGDQEMCILFGFAESSVEFRGTVEHTEAVDPGPPAEHTGPCEVIALRRE
jgi:hypothetical protein